MQMTVNEAIQELESRKALLMQSCVECWDPAMQMALQALKAQRWIPCSERLPKESDYYLVTFDSITRPVGIFFFDAQYGGCWVDEMGNRLKTKFFVAWMPLPEPYEVEE